VAWHTARLDPICRALEECTRSSRATLDSSDETKGRMRLALAMRATTMQSRVSAAITAALQGQANQSSSTSTSPSFSGGNNASERGGHSESGGASGAQALQAEADSSSPSTSDSGGSNASEVVHSDAAGASSAQANQPDGPAENGGDISESCDDDTDDDDDDDVPQLDSELSPSPPHILSRIQSLTSPVQKNRRARRQSSHRRDALMNAMTRAYSETAGRRHEHKADNDDEDR